MNANEPAVAVASRRISSVTGTPPAAVAGIRLGDLIAVAPLPARVRVPTRE